jgi:hypothetical protein
MRENESAKCENSTIHKSGKKLPWRPQMLDKTGKAALKGGDIPSISERPPIEWDNHFLGETFKIIFAQ